MGRWKKREESARESGVAAAVPAGPLAERVINEKDGTELLLVAAGKFLRGALPSQGDPDERPQMEIHLDAFYIAKSPVTNKQYRKFLEASGHAEPKLWNDPVFNGDDQPVVGVSWEDAAAYCQWAGLRLPTEAEWEKAASWDEKNKLKRWWPWGDVEPDPERANYANNVGHTTPVGRFGLNESPYGCLDMAGNVWEWCQDFYLYNYYEKSPDANPAGPARQPYRVLRGGSFKRPAEYISTTYRYWFSETFADVETGFRCAKTP